MSTQQNTKEIIEQLKESKIHGFNFFIYTGIKKILSNSDGDLILKLPSDSPKYNSVVIKLDVSDTYTLEFYKKYDLKNTVKDIYVDQLAETITRETGVY
jgi:hypothetical protein